MDDNPRLFSALAMLFAAMVTAVAGLCAFTIKDALAMERDMAKREIAAMERQFKSETEVIKERAKLNTESFSRLIDKLTPVVNQEVTALRDLRANVSTLIRDEPNAAVIYAKLSEVEMKMAFFQEQLRSEGLRFQGLPVTTASASQLPPVFWLFHVLGRWCLMGAGAFILLFATVVVLFRFRPKIT